MNLKLKYYLYLLLISLVQSIKENEICLNSLIFPEKQFSSNYYLNTITSLTSQCEDNCDKCIELKTNKDTKCILCNPNFFLYKFRCVEKCPNDTYTYTYKTKIINGSSESIETIKACNEICEEGYTGIIFQENNANMSNKTCVFNYNENISDYITEKLNDFKILDYENKLIIIHNLYYSIINDFDDINNNENFELLNKKLILFNEYINSDKSILQKDNNIGENLNEIYQHYFSLIENYSN